MILTQLSVELLLMNLFNDSGVKNYSELQFYLKRVLLKICYQQEILCLYGSMGDPLKNRSFPDKTGKLELMKL